MPGVTVKCSIFRFSRCSIWLGGCWKLSCAFCFIGLQLWSGAPCLRYQKDPLQRTALLGPGNKDGIKSQPKFFQVEMVLPWQGGGSSAPLCYPTLPSQPFSHGCWVARPRTPVPIPTRPPCFGSVCTSRRCGDSPSASACLLPEKQRNCS